MFLASVAMCRNAGHNSFGHRVCERGKMGGLYGLPRARPTVAFSQKSSKQRGAFWAEGFHIGDLDLSVGSVQA